MPKSAESNPIYRRVFSDAFRISWRHKHLWIFGFFAAFAGFGGIGDIIVNIFDKISALSMGPGRLADLIPGTATIKALALSSSRPGLTVIVFAAIIALILAVMIWVVVGSIGALISGVRKVRQGSDLHFSQGVTAGAASFWPLLWINGGAKAIAFLSFCVTGLNLYVFVNDSTALGLSFYVGSFILLSVLAAFVTVMAVYASNYVVVRSMDLQGSLVEAWRLFAANFVVSVETIILLFLVEAAISVLGILGALIASVPVFFLFMLSMMVGAQGAAVAMVVIGVILILLIIMALGAFLTTFQASVWTSLWSELAERKVLSKLHRLLGRR